MSPHDKEQEPESVFLNVAVHAQACAMLEETHVLTGESLSLKLENIRSALNRQEETLIFALIERAQFRLNASIYDPKAFRLESLSFLDYLLLETEKVHARVRRYTSPDELPFFPLTSLPDPILPEAVYPKSIVPNQVNLNEDIKQAYLESIVPELCLPGDDGHFGSSALGDVSVLQILSKRIHYGKFVAEAKFLRHRDKFVVLIRRGDRERILDAITDAKVEEQVLDRIQAKAAAYGRNESNPGAPQLIDPLLVRKVYEKIVIPLTKQVQLLYLLDRLKHE